MQLVVQFSLLLINFSKGLVTISPSRIVSVCSGNQLDLTCTTNETFLRWEFTVITSGGTAMTFDRTVSSIGPSNNIESVTVNSTILFMFTRMSSQDSSPLKSRLSIHPVTTHLNGTALNCMEVVSAERSTTTIHIIQEAVTLPDVTIGLHSEQFQSDDVTVLLEWNNSDSQVFYNVSVSPQLSVDLIRRTSIQLMVPYNTFYNVSVTPYLCRQVGTTTSIQLNYTKCGNISVDNDDSLMVVGYRDPAREGTNLSFSCLSGTMLAGPNVSTCTEEGQWEPDPREVVCKAACETPQCIVHRIADSITITDYRDSNIAQQTLSNSCCSGIIVTGQNGMACMEEGQWELSTTQMEMTREGVTAGSHEVLTIALVCTVCGFAVFSAFMFVIGFLCGHRFGQTGCCKQMNTVQSDDVIPEVPPMPVRRQEQDLELKENVAYETFHTTHIT